MALIHDIMNKIKAWKPRKPLVIYAEDHADKLICSKCGNQYVSRGKFDCGICRDCESKLTQQNASLIGGPFDGEKAGGSDDQ